MPRCLDDKKAGSRLNTMVSLDQASIDMTRSFWRARLNSAVEKESAATYLMDLKGQDLIMPMKLWNPHNWEEYPSVQEHAGKRAAKTTWEETPTAPSRRWTYSQDLVRTIRCSPRQRPNLDYPVWVRNPKLRSLKMGRRCQVQWLMTRRQLLII